MAQGKRPGHPGLKDSFRRSWGDCLGSFRTAILTAPFRHTKQLEVRAEAYLISLLEADGL